MITGKMDHLRVQMKLADTEERKQFLHEFSADEIKRAIVESNDRRKPLEELIATAEAAFEFVRLIEMDRCTKDAFGVLEREFEFWRKLVGE